MPVGPVIGEEPLQAGHVYVIPPGRQLQITQQTIAAIPFPEPRGRHAPIDSCFRSLATRHGGSFAVILSGGGSDGAVGVKAVKEAGGIILVQDPAEAEYPSMPSAAIGTEVVDFVLPIKQLAARLTDLIRSKDDMQFGEGSGQGGETVTQLRRELGMAQARLCTMREQAEAANAELQSINEEYRSTAEELETRKEELQSINEELQTVNSELKLKLETASRADSDLQNLMAAMDFGTCSWILPCASSASRRA